MTTQITVPAADDHRETHAHHGYISEKEKYRNRLSRLEGQVRGIDRMVADEALLLYTYDGTASPPRFVFHTAVDTGRDGPPRRSIEVRCLAIF